MTPSGNSDPKNQIVATYAEWTALSALRSGAPIKSRQDVYSVIRAADFDPLFAKSRGGINSSEFGAWHAETTRKMVRIEPRLNVGWATKIVNVYLKTRAYIGSQGRHHLTETIHPPIDAGLWKGLRRRFPNRPDILSKSNCVGRIKDIQDYSCYLTIIDGCRMAASALNCKLIEVEQLWTGTEIAVRRASRSP